MRFLIAARGSVVSLCAFLLVACGSNGGVGADGREFVDARVDASSARPDALLDARTIANDGPALDAR